MAYAAVERAQLADASALERQNSDSRFGVGRRVQSPDTDQLAGSFKQDNEYMHGATPESHWFVAFQQKKLCRE